MTFPAALTLFTLAGIFHYAGLVMAIRQWPETRWVPLCAVGGALWLMLFVGIGLG